MVPADEQPALRAGLLFVCVWESIALSTGQLPTISCCVRRLPPWARLAILAVAAGALGDHWTSRRWVK